MPQEQFMQRSQLGRGQGCRGVALPPWPRLQRCCAAAAARAAEVLRCREGLGHHVQLGGSDRRRSGAHTAWRLQRPKGCSSHKAAAVTQGCSSHKAAAVTRLQRSQGCSGHKAGMSTAQWQRLRASPRLCVPHAGL
eukprot:365107-Chlamydomonas_euryale.AAC.7